MASFILEINNEHVDRVLEAFEAKNPNSGLTPLQNAKTQVINYIKDTVKCYEKQKLQENIKNQIDNLEDVDIN